MNEIKRAEKSLSKIFNRDLLISFSSEVDEMNEITEESLTGIISVSYTHLDVYKRQLEHVLNFGIVFQHIGIDFRCTLL